MSRRIRLLLLATVVGVAGALLLSPAQAQFPPGGAGGRPGGIGGQPGGIGGGIGGQRPGNIGGINGGVAGQPGNIGGINGQPGNNGGIAGQPGFQGNGIAGGMGNPPQMPKIGPPQYEWVCSGCGAVVSQGPFKPQLLSCPKCGVRFRDGPGAGIDFNQGAEFAPPAVGAAPAQNGPNNANAAAFQAGRTMGRLMVFGAVGLGGLLVVVAIVVVLIIVLSRAGSTAPTPRRSRSRSYHDD